MSARELAAGAVLLTLLGGCASTSGPIVDTKGMDPVRYQQDLAECQGYGSQVQPARGAAKGAAAGAAVGAAIGAISGGSGTRGAGVGAVTGGAQSAVHGVREKDAVVKNCLRGRGYRVLN
jgi:outer membrane lipoprotein SlyB